MSSPACRDIRLALGVYVVGAIDPTERTIVEVHLSHCPACREELAGLAGLPALLGRVPVGDAERLALDSAEVKNLEEPPAKLLSSLLDEVAARRKVRRWRVITAAAAAAVIAVGGGLAGGMAVSGSLSHSAPGKPEFVQGVNQRAHITADVSYAPAAGGAGTTMQVRVTGIALGTRCKFWVVRSDGKRWLTTSWTVGSGQEGYWAASSPVYVTRVAGFLVTSHGKTLVNIPAGGPS
jgi:anti-sigma factor RsiW